jgi:GH24 family phage-related lysozyme (muramidase)
MMEAWTCTCEICGTDRELAWCARWEAVRHLDDLLLRRDWRMPYAGSVLERLTGKAVASFAYPYGMTESFDDATVRAVADAGYQRACATGGKHWRKGPRRFRLPRRIVQDWGSDEFGRRLRR